jgi:ABC-2 type transport system permease protein
MQAEVSRLDLRLRRRSLLGYSLGMAAYAFIIVALYPAFRDSASLNALTRNGNAVAALFGATGSLTSPAGWLNANIYQNFLPLIVLLATIGYGASAIAGQDEDGVLSLTAALPVSRRAILAQKALTLVVQAVVVAVATMILVLAGRGFQLSVSTTHLTGITIGVALLGIDFGLLALAIGAATGRRGTALGVTSAIAAASYLISSLAPVVNWIRPARYASLFYWAVGNQQLSSGLSAGAAATLVVTGVILLAAAIAAFRRLDLR